MRLVEKVIDKIPSNEGGFFLVLLLGAGVMLSGMLTLKVVKEVLIAWAQAQGCSCG